MRQAPYSLSPTAHRTKIATARICSRCGAVYGGVVREQITRLFDESI